jgi:hypothetical protein
MKIRNEAPYLRDQRDGSWVGGGTRGEATGFVFLDCVWEPSMPGFSIWRHIHSDSLSIEMMRLKDAFYAG